MLFLTLGACDALVGISPESKQITISALRTYHDGKDGWGREVHYVSRILDGKMDFILVSPGADGELDVDDIESYFTAEKQNVTGDFDADLIN